MRIIESLDFELNKDTAVTIGKFDGIHRGHRELLDRVLAKRSEGLSPTVFTFDKAPSEVFSGVKAVSLTTMEEKIRIFEYLGFDTLVIYPLTKETAAISPEDYITELLCKQMKARYIAAGDDLSFGDKGAGNSKLLQDMAKDCGYETEIINKISIDGEEVSSSFIREIVASGDMEKAAKFIGVPYAVTGNVLHGRKLGRKMGFPTVNIEVSKEKLMPPFGVYFAEISIDGVHYNGITNVGLKPTVSNSDTVYAETNIFDFDDDVYGKRITVKLLHFLRKEIKFDTIEELRSQIDSDIEKGKEYFLL